MTQQFSAPRLDRDNVLTVEHIRIAVELPTHPPVRASAPLYGAAGKRVFDVSVAVAVLTLGAPVFMILMLAVRLSSRGPVFYSHLRVGRYGRLFRCWKFRTMVADADERLRRLFEERPELRNEFDLAFKLRTDPRVTRIGRFLRRTSLDELPQFVNVLRGHMSVVGPRPLVPSETVRYGDAIDTVLEVRPGITGLWQVSGRNDIAYPDRVAMDARYVRSLSLVGDLGIVVRTVLLMVLWTRSGAY